MGLHQKNIKISTTTRRCFMKKVLLLIGLLVLTGCTQQKNTAYKEVKKNQGISHTTKVKKTTYAETTTPTLFIHGYQGGNSSFKSMLKRMEKSDITKKELVLYVADNGEVTSNGELSGKAGNPTIQVIFENNISHEWNQAEWIKNCLVFLQTKENISKVNIVGHSMGGVSALRYLLTYSEEKNLPKVEKFIAIGSPFNNFVEPSDTESIDTLISKGPKIQSDRYADFTQRIDQLPVETDYLIIAGDIEDGSESDGTVGLQDVLSIVSLLKNKTQDVSYELIYGSKGQHSQLHENPEVDQLVLDFLYLQ